ncbi:hypothetical protein RPMA_15575 [Tardiphaga alba]|uniref:TonB C-terminal domain-containing protein n=1 Tax=Tardiphaga alba TaxID=340268 RepID=A0ABX8AAT0_9BRAD|nr:hypothetical protein RPMA_15575 [Tardiphaga alba]
MLRRGHIVLLAALMLIGPARVHTALAQEGTVSTLDGMFEKLKGCWRGPELPRGHLGMQITVLFSFKRDGELLGRPRITFETPGASDTDSIAYRTAVMETLQRCSPMPFSGGLGDAVAGRPFRVRFDDRRNQPKPVERKAWLSPKIL